MPFEPALTYCASLVRSQDYDRYLCTLFAPAAVQEPWFALFAFNQEIAAIPESVSEPMMGFMRYAWWREALDEVFGQGTVRRHPVVQALAEVVARHHLPRMPFDALMQARESAFAGNVPQAVRQWEEYFQATSSDLLAQCAHVANVRAGETVDALGLAWGFTGMARVLLQQNEKKEAEAMRQAAAMWLEKGGALPQAFLPFKNNIAFYINRMRAGKGTGRESSLALIASMGWSQLANRINSSPSKASRKKPSV